MTQPTDITKELLFSLFLKKEKSSPFFEGTMGEKKKSLANSLEERAEV